MSCFVMVCKIYYGNDRRFYMWNFLRHPIQTVENGLRQKLQAVKPYGIALAVYLVILEITVAIGVVALVKLAFFN